MEKINFDEIYSTLQDKKNAEEINNYIRNLTIMFMELIIKKKNLLGSEEKYLYSNKNYYTLIDIENKSEEKKKEIFKINVKVKNELIFIISKLIEELIILNDKNINVQEIDNNKSYIVSCSILKKIKEMKNEILLFNFKKKYLINYQNDFRKKINENINNIITQNIKEEKKEEEKSKINKKINISNSKDSDESDDESDVESDSDESDDEPDDESDDELDDESKTKQVKTLQNREYIIKTIDEFLKLIAIKIAINMYFKRMALIKNDYFIPLLLDIFKKDIFNKKSYTFDFKKMNEYVSKNMKPKRIKRN